MAADAIRSDREISIATVKDDADVTGVSKEINVTSAPLGIGAFQTTSPVSVSFPVAQ